MTVQSAKSAKHSQTTITELMIPSYANFGGKIHGGILLSLMDKVAYACASKHAGNYCVTVSVDTVDFLMPVEVGDLVSLKASVNYVGRSSLVVGIKVIAENVKKGMVKHTNTSYFTMVAKDESDKPTMVPPLMLESKEDIRRFVEAIDRKEIKRSSQNDMQQSKQDWSLNKALALVDGERCEVKIPEK